MSFSLAEAIVYFQGDQSELHDKLDDSEKKTGSSVGNMAKQFSTVLVAGIGVAVGALVGIGTAAFNVASDIDAATDQIGASLGLNEEQAKKFGAAIKQVYGNNFGDSLGDVGKGIEEVAKRLKLAADDPSLVKITEGAFALRDVFEIDIAESIDTVNILMENFGLTATEAMDYLVAANQRGLNSSGDLLDTIGEYSVQFNQNGASASEFFKFLEAGNQGGMLGTDKAADAMKEFGIRILDNSDLTRNSLTAIGIDYDRLTQGIEDGSETQFWAMQDVLHQIFKIEDPVKRATIGVGLFGTQWEDMGEKALRKLEEIEEGFGPVAGATDSLNIKYTSLGSVAEGMWRKFQVGIAPAGEAILGMVNENLPLITQFVETASGKIVEFINLIPATMTEVRRKWDEDWAGMQTTLTEWQVTSTQQHGVFWMEWNKTFDMESGETIFNWENLFRIMLAVHKQKSTEINESNIEFLRYLGLQREIWGALFAGDWERMWDAIGNMADAALSRMTDRMGTWGAEAREVIVQSLLNVWEGMKTIWETVSAWWNNSFGKLLNLGETSTTPYRPDLGIVNPLNTTPSLDGYENLRNFFTPGNGSQPQAQGSSINDGVTVNNLNVNVGNGGDPFDAGREVVRGIEYERRLRGE